MLSSIPASGRRRRLVALFGSFAACCVLSAGCSSGRQSATPTWKGRDTLEARDAVLKISDEQVARFGYRRDWKGYPVMSKGQTVLELHPFEDVVIAREGGSTVTALNTSTGEQRWFEELANPLTKFVGMERTEGWILAAAEAELMFLDPATGTLRDRQLYGTIVRTAPVLAPGNLAILGTSRGEILAHYMGTGVKAWGYLTPSTIEVNLVRVGNAVGAVSQAGQITFVGVDGSLLGANKIFAGSVVDPVTDGSRMFVASLDQSLYAFNPDGAELIWQYRTSNPLRSQPVYHEGTLYCAIEGQGMVAFDPATGAVRWSNEELSGTVVATRGGRLIVLGDDEVLAVNPSRGTITERMAAEGVAFMVADAPVDGNLYVVSDGGVISKYTPR